MENICFRARIVILANKFPGFPRFSSFSMIQISKPHAIVTQSQYRYMLEELTGSQVPDLPYKSLNLKLTDAALKDKEVYE